MEKNIHQIWIGPYKMPKRETELVEKVKTLQSYFIHMLWTDENLPLLPKPILDAYNFLYKKRGYAQAANVLRIYVINLFGGVYLDVDFEFREGISEFHLENYDAFFAIHPANVITFPNGVFGMKKNHPISNYLLNDIRTGESGDRYFTPVWWGNMIKKYFGVVDDITHIEFARRFFEPNNIFYINYDHVFHIKHYYHHALYSWSDKIRKQFEEGTIE